jgi:hypothetical protein
LNDRKDEATRKLRKRSRILTQNLAGRSEQILLPVRETGRRVWPVVGFFAGMVLAAGVTYWLVQRGLRQRYEARPTQITLAPHQNGHKLKTRFFGEIRSNNQGRKAGANRPDTEALNRFVGVLSTKEYYPITNQPDARDVVFFTSEDAAKSQGFNAAQI